MHDSNDLPSREDDPRFASLKQVVEDAVRRTMLSTPCFDADRLVDAAEACRITNCTEQGLYKLAERGLIRARRFSRRTVRFRLGDLLLVRDGNVKTDRTTPHEECDGLR